MTSLILDECLAYDHALINVRVTANEDVGLRASISYQKLPPRLEIQAKCTGSDEEFTAIQVAFVYGPYREGTDIGNGSLISAVDGDGHASLRLDAFLQQMHPETASTHPNLLTGRAMARYLDMSCSEDEASGGCTTFLISIALIPVQGLGPNPCAPFPIHTLDLVTAEDKLLMERKTFRVSRELLAIHSEFFRAQLYGDFNESGKTKLDIKMFTTEEFRMISVALMRKSVIESASAAISLLAHTDFLQAPWLHARAAEALDTMPFLDSEEDKEQWFFAADKYNADALVDKLVLTMTKEHASRLLAKTFTTIDKNPGQAGHLLAQRGADMLKTFTIAFPGGKVTILLRTNDEKELDEYGKKVDKKSVNKDVSSIPCLAYKWKRFPEELDKPLEAYGVKIPKLSFASGGSNIELGSVWKLCSYRDREGWLYLSKERAPVVDTILGDVVVGERVLEGRINGEQVCMGRVLKQ